MSTVLKNKKDSLSLAIKNNDLDLISDILKTFQPNDHTFSFQAIKQDNIDILQLLIQNGLIINNSCFLEAIKMYCLKKTKRLDMIQFIIRNEIDVNFNESYAINVACEVGSIDLVIFLLSKNAFISNTCVCYAGVFGHFDIFNLLLDHGADISKENYKCIQWILRRGIYKMVYDILEHRKTYIPNEILEIEKYAIPFKKYVQLQKFKEKMRCKAANKIYFWWISICYNVNTECGKRMMEKSWNRVENYYKEYICNLN